MTTTEYEVMNKRIDTVVDIIDELTCDRIAEEFYNKFGIELADMDYHNKEQDDYWLSEYNKTVEMFKKVREQ